MQVKFETLYFVADFEIHYFLKYHLNEKQIYSK